MIHQNDQSESDSFGGSCKFVAAGAGVGGATAGTVSLWKLGLFFVKVGAVMYGGGYVLVAYLEGGLLGVYPGFDSEQLLDAMAIGQLTPGPMLTTATFAGYLIAGWLLW